MIEIVETAFNPWQYLQNVEQQLLAQRGSWGAVATFTGTMRDFNEGDNVQGMFLEHYPGMTERYLQNICTAALEQWDILDTLIVHRVGNMLPGDTIVLTAVWAAHRAPAFAACRYLIEELKYNAPFWKNETLSEGKRWVTRNTSA